MYLLKSKKFGKERRSIYRFQIYRNNKLITQVGFFDPYTCRGGLNLKLLSYYLDKGLFLFPCRYRLVIDDLIQAYFILNNGQSAFTNNELKTFIKSATPFKSNYQQYRYNTYSRILFNNRLKDN